jgi:hypothetical protein
MRANHAATPSRGTVAAARSAAAAAAPAGCPIKLTPESPGARRRTGPGYDDAATEAAAEPDSGTEAVHVAGRARASKRSYAAVATPREGRAAKSRKSLAGERRGPAGGVSIANAWCVSVTHDPCLAVFVYMHLHALAACCYVGVSTPHSLHDHATSSAFVLSCVVLLLAPALAQVTGCSWLLTAGAFQHGSARSPWSSGATSAWSTRATTGVSGCAMQTCAG